MQTIGFIGLGVMGGAMCRNMARRQTGARILVHDIDPQAVATATGAAGNIAAAGSVAAVGAGAGVVFLCMPNPAVLEQLVRELAGVARPGTVIVDTSTTGAGLTRQLAALLAERGVTLLDAPISKTRAAAEAGTLSIMVGGDPQVYAQILPLLETMGTDVTYCGPSGSGQVVKILNNMVLFQTINALSEALAIAERQGVPGDLLFDVFERSSADSFALRNHGRKALLPGEFPLRAFSVRYANKDIGCALDLARGAGIEARGAELVEQLFDQSIGAGQGDDYFPTIHRRHSRG